MIHIGTNRIINSRNFILLFLTLQLTSCYGQVKNKSANNSADKALNNQPLILNKSTTFPQIHTNLNGMVSQFVRTIYQDKKGNYWFGTNGDGIIRYDGQTLKKMTIEQNQKFVSVREITEDKVGNIWFGTSSGLVKYKDEIFTTYSTEAGLQNEDVWGLTIDKKR